MSILFCCYLGSLSALSDSVISCYCMGILSSISSMTFCQSILFGLQIFYMPVTVSFIRFFRYVVPSVLISCVMSLLVMMSWASRKLYQIQHS